jgi:hypothetical protein
MAGSGRHGADDALALALSTGKTLVDAARTANISEKTARRRWGDAGFRQRVSDLRGEVIAQAASHLAATMTRAAERLAELVESEDSKTALSAAKAVLSLGLLAREKVDNEAQMLELQERLELIENERGGQDAW